MDETHLPPLPVQPPDQPTAKLNDSNTNAPPEGVKLSDLNAVKQQIIAQAGITLTAIGLLITGSGTIGRLMPEWSDNPPPQPFLVYLAAICLPFGAFHALQALGLRPKLKPALVARLKIAKGHPDAVSPELQSVFVDNIERCLGHVDLAKDGLFWGSMALLAHAYFLYLSHLMVKSQNFTSVIKSIINLEVSDTSFLYYISSFISVFAIVIIELVGYFRNLKTRRQKP